MRLLKSSFVIALFLLCLQVSGQSQRDSIRVAGGNSFRPGLYLGTGGKPNGIYYDLWEIWSRKTGIKIQWRLMDWPKTIPALLAGEVDVVLGVTYTQERTKYLDFTTPYGYTTTYIYYHKEIGGIKDLDDLEGFPIGILESTNIKLDLDAKYGSRLILIGYDNYFQLVEAIEDEKVRVFIAEEQNMYYYLSRFHLTGLFRHLKDPLHVSDLRAAVSKGNKELLELLENGLALITEEEKKAVFDKWYGSSIPLHIPWMEIGLVALAAFTLIGLLFLWNRILKSRIYTATKSLRQSEESFRELVEQSPLSMQVHDLDGRMVMANKAWAKLWGVGNAQKQLGKYNILKDAQLKDSGYFKAIKKAMAGKVVDIPVSIYDPTQSNIPGRKRHTHVHLYPLKDTAGVVKNIVITHEDLTAKIKAENKQKELESRMLQAEKLEAIGQLAGGIAHDFNNMLAGIMGYADVLCMSLEDGEMKEIAQGIVRAANRSKALTDQLLAFARKGRYRSIRLDIHKVIEEVVSLLKHTIDKRIRLIQDFRADSPFIMGDPDQLQNAFLNLAINACDAMPSGGELIFSTETVTPFDKNHRRFSEELKPGNYLMIAVKDTGTGLTPEVQKKIFEPFFTTKAARKHIGMGLPAVYGIVKSHGGAINVQSEKGKGSTFQIFLPLVEDQAAAFDKKEVPENVPFPTMCYRLLVIDDEEIVGEMIEKLMTHLGHTVKILNNGREAIEFYSNNWQEYDVIILDLVMPDISGKEIFRALSKINPSVKVILSSGYSINGEAQKILKEGALDFIQKPFKGEELALKIETIMGASTEEK
jgi:two-component system cell cycle sensor histidine kinase/response regulator CckA